MRSALAVPIAAALALVGTPTARAQQAPTPPPSLPPPPPSLPAAPSVPHVPVLIESVGRPQDIAEFRGTVFSTHRSGRFGYVRTADPYGPTLCTTPCTLSVAPGEFKFISRGPSLVTTVQTVAIPAAGLRVRLRAPRSSAVVGGGALVALAVTLDLLGTGFIVFDRAFSAHDEALIAGAAFLGSSALFGSLGSVLLALNPTGIASTEPLRETVLPTVVIGALGGGGAAVRVGWRF